jgi:hypothetical protein
MVLVCSILYSLYPRVVYWVTIVCSILYSLYPRLVYWVTLVWRIEQTMVTQYTTLGYNE